VVARKRMSWDQVADKQIGCYKTVLKQLQEVARETQALLQLPLNISHLIHLTDEVGIFQHAEKILPNVRFGYSTDDNARALIIMSLLHRKKATEQTSKMLEVYLQFLLKAQGKDGSFHTFLSNNGEWIDRSTNSDAYGRAMWGLGRHLYSQKGGKLSAKAQLMFESGLKQSTNIHDLRTAAYTILGLYYYLKAHEENTAEMKIAKNQMMYLGEYLMSKFLKSHTESWLWYEEMITYDSFRIPQAMLAVYLITRKPIYKKIAEKSLQFLYECSFNQTRNYFDFIGQDGWHKKNGYKANYDQQPLEAAGAVEAYIFADKAVPHQKYLTKGKIAFEWFFGRNRNHRSIYDQVNKGVFDGLTPRGVNLNEGSESIICFLMAQWSLQRAIAKT
jgi:hypothetical protein